MVVVVVLSTARAVVLVLVMVLLLLSLSLKKKIIIIITIFFKILVVVAAVSMHSYLINIVHHLQAELYTHESRILNLMISELVYNQHLARTVGYR